jgi:hypothetical protein
MATTTPDGLQALLAAVGVEDPIPSFPLADTQNNPLGIYLSYLADTLVELAECEPQVAYESIQWPNELGDLAVVLPRLRLQDVKLEELAADLTQRVGVALSQSRFSQESNNLSQSNAHISANSSHLRLFSTVRSRITSIYGFYSPQKPLPACSCPTSSTVGLHTART